MHTGREGVLIGAGLGTANVGVIWRWRWGMVEAGGCVGRWMPLPVGIGCYYQMGYY